MHCCDWTLKNPHLDGPDRGFGGSCILREVSPASARMTKPLGKTLVDFAPSLQAHGAFSHAASIGIVIDDGVVNGAPFDLKSVGDGSAIG